MLLPRPQGGRVTSLALTDTQLLLGSTAGVVQSLDLFSGQQQLITRHSSGVACLLTHRQQQPLQLQQQQQEQLGLGTEEWVTLVGCVDGQVGGCFQQSGLCWAHEWLLVKAAMRVQMPTSCCCCCRSQLLTAMCFHPLQVSCVSSATGRVLWQLPTRYPSKVVSLQLVDCQPGGVHTPSMQTQQQQQQQSREQRQTRRRQTSEGSAQPQQRHVLLYVLNARSQVVCWQLPAAVLESTSAAAAIDGQLQLPSWPLSVCSVAAPTPQQAPTSQLQSDDHAQQQQEQQAEGRRQLVQVPHNSCTCMLSPLFGRDCLLVGSRLGYVTVAQLHQQDDTAAAGGSAAGVSQPTGSNDEATGAGGSIGDGTTAAGAAHAAPVVAVPSAAPPPAAAGSASEAAAGVAAESAQQPASQACQPSQQAATHSGRHSWGLSVVRHCSSHKLGRLLAGRQAHSTATHSSSSATTATAAAAAAGSSASSSRHKGHSAPVLRDGVDPDTRAAARAQQHLLDGCKVCCMQWGPGGQLLLGLGSGHVCCLRFKHAATSAWA